MLLQWEGLNVSTPQGMKPMWAHSESVKGSCTLGVEELGVKTKSYFRRPSPLHCLFLWIDQLFLSLSLWARNLQLVWGTLEKSPIIALSLYAFGLSKYRAYSPGATWTTSHWSNWLWMTVSALKPQRLAAQSKISLQHSLQKQLLQKLRPSQTAADFQCRNSDASSACLLYCPPQVWTLRQTSKTKPTTPKWSCT